MTDILNGITGTSKTCPKCGKEMVLAGKIKKKGKLVKVWRCPKCNYRTTE